WDVNKKGKSACQAGSLIFHNWQDPHYNAKETTLARGFHIEFPRQWFEQQQLKTPLWEGSSLIDHPTSHLLLAQLFFEFRFQDEHSKLSIELLLLQLCENIREQNLPRASTPAWIDTLKQLLQEETTPLSLEMLSGQLGVHPIHISRAVPKYLGCSLGDYIRRQKIKRALAYFFNPQLSLTEIAYLCGFADQSHFTRTFKSYLKQTPSAFRKGIKQRL
ncbi:MAG: helix-turn-helix transcriptional regulator, partial [Bacteroidota bacterium]